jgi:hypothetical protein
MSASAILHAGAEEIEIMLRMQSDSVGANGSRIAIRQPQGQLGSVFKTGFCRLSLGGTRTHPCASGVSQCT